MTCVRFIPVVVLLLVQVCFASPTVPATAPADIDPAAPPEQLALQLSRLCEQVRDEGLRNDRALSLALLRQGAAGDWERRALYAHWARRVSPDLPPAYLAEGVAAWRQSPLAVHRLVTGYLRSARAVVRDRAALYNILMHGGITVGLALWLALTAWALVLCARQIPWLAHDIAHVTGARLPRFAGLALLLLVLTFPIFCGWSLASLPPYWLVLFFAYGSRQERLLSLLLVLAWLVLVPCCAALVGTIGAHSVDARQNLIWRANYDRCSAQDRAWLTSRAGDVQAGFSLGLVSARAGNFRAALGAYQQLPDADLFGGRVALNRANTLLMLDRADAAVAGYRAAAAHGGTVAAAAHFNLSRVRQQQFRLNAADEHLATAIELDRTLITRYLRLYTERYNRLLIDLPLARSTLYLSGIELSRLHADRVWQLVHAGPVLPWGPLLLIGIGGLLGVTAHRRGMLRAYRCRTCGVTTCSRCTRDVHDAAQCPRCDAFLNRSLRMSRRDRRQIIDTLYRRMNRRRRFLRVLCVCVPGGALMAKGVVWWGTLAQLVASLVPLLLVSLMVFGSPWGVLAAGVLAVMGPLALLGALLWVATAVVAFRCRDRHRLVVPDIQTAG